MPLSGFFYVKLKTLRTSIKSLQWRLKQSSNCFCVPTWCSLSQRHSGYSELILMRVRPRCRVKVWIRLTKGKKYLNNSSTNAVWNNKSKMAVFCFGFPLFSFNKDKLDPKICRGTVRHQTPLISSTSIFSWQKCVTHSSSLWWRLVDFWKKLYSRARY